MGGHVRKGEHGTTVVYADRFIPDDEKKRATETGEEAQAIPFLKRFTVFNIDQCDGLPEQIATVAPPPPPGTIEPRVEALIKATGIEFRIGGSRAFYIPSQDYVQVPPPAAYFEPINWHRTALHELGHASGHRSRLNRDLSGTHGSKKYAFEELIAELCAAFSCASLGIVPTVRHADYIGSWLEVLREDNRAIVRAASQALHPRLPARRASTIRKVHHYRQREGGMILLTPELRGRLQRIMGRKVSPAWVVSASAIGVSALTPEGAHAALVDGKTVLDLAEGFQLRRVRVMGASRIELTGFTVAMRERLTGYGLFHQIFSWKLPMFVPTDGAGIDVLRKVLERYPLARRSERAA